MDLINIIVQEEIMEQNHIDVIGHAALNLAEPLPEEVQERRQVVPRNENYYENTIANYMGDLFVEHFRMSRSTFDELLRTVGNLPNFRPSAIPLEEKLLFTIWMLAKPECFLAGGDRFGLSRSTAHGVFKEVVLGLVTLMPQYIRWPEALQDITNGFQERSGFPSVVGAIDGCHIPIKQPRNNPHDYYNRKEYHSIILQGICDHKLQFLDVFVGMPGRVHDARVFRNSPIYQRMTYAEHPLLEADQHVLGDSAYPLMQNLLTPFRDNGHLNPIQINFNYQFSALRSTIERTFALLLNKFRRLKNLDVDDPDFGSQIILACCILHNFILRLDEENIDLRQDDIEEMPGNIFDQNEGEENAAQQKRNNIANMLYNRRR